MWRFIWYIGILEEVVCFVATITTKNKAPIVSEALLTDLKVVGGAREIIPYSAFFIFDFLSQFLAIENCHSSRHKNALFVKVTSFYGGIAALRLKKNSAK